MNYRDWIIRDPKTKDGQPVLKGTEITLKTVLGHLALGDTIENIVQAYPGMQPEGVRAVIAFAASFADLELKETISLRPAKKLDELSLKEIGVLTSTIGTEFLSVAVADMYVRQHLYSEAARIFRNILKLQPDNSGVKKKLEDIEKKINREDQSI